MTTLSERADIRRANAAARERRHVAVTALVAAGLSGSQVAEVMARCGIPPARGSTWNARSIANISKRLREEPR